MLFFCLKFLVTKQTESLVDEQSVALFFQRHSRDKTLATGLWPEACGTLANQLLAAAKPGNKKQKKGLSTCQLGRLARRALYFQPADKMLETPKGLSCFQINLFVFRTCSLLLVVFLKYLAIPKMFQVRRWLEIP